MREEAYDHVKDRIAMAGGDPSSPKKSDATTQPYRRADKVKGKTVYQKQAEKKYGKGVTALDIVKSKIKKSGGKIMGEETLQEKSQEGGRSNFGKASVRNMRRFGYGGNNAARLGQGEKRGEAIDKRTAEHKASRGVKGSTQKREDKMKPVKWSDKNNNDNRTEEFTAEAMDSGSGVGYEPGKPAAKLGAIKLISKKEADAARERILAKTKAKREAAKKKEDKNKQEVKAVPADTMEGMYDIDPKTGKSPVASSVEKGNKKKGEKRLKHFAKLAKKMVGEGTVAKDMCKKNCGCGQDPCITYGEQTQKPAAARPADKVMVSELSKKTYGSYVKKAATEIGTSAMKGDYKKMQKRHKGVLDASDKLQKEELKMTKKEYSKIHKDFKSDDPKKPRTTKYVPGKGTVSMPVKFVDEAVYTGPNKEDRKQIKKMDNPSYAKKLADYEKNMDPKKRQALKDKATKGMKFTVEAMSSYDRNRKAAAKRAAERNRLRKAGKMGGRMERETYRSEGGTEMHHKGYKVEEINPTVEKAVQALDEISKKTLGSYVKKAATEIGTSAMKGDYKKMQKRHKGVLDASDKLQKEGVYTGPNKEDRKVIKKLDDKDFAKKAADYEKNMDPKKRQELKDKATKGMKFTHEGTSYGMYKGSGKPSGAMAAFAKKDKEKKKEVKKEGLTMMILGKEVEMVEACWKGYEKKGMKTMFGKRYPNCVKKTKKEEVELPNVTKQAKVVKGKRTGVLPLSDPKTQVGVSGGYKKEEVEQVVEHHEKDKDGNTIPHNDEKIVNESDKKGKGSGTKDACYHKVKSRYSVWPVSYTHLRAPRDS